MVRALLELSVSATFPVIGVLRAVERAGPLIAERSKGGTPSHAHHIVERSALLVIIALGDAIIGTVPAVCSGDGIVVDGLERRPDPRESGRR